VALAAPARLCDVGHGTPAPVSVEENFPAVESGNVFMATFHGSDKRIGRACRLGATLMEWPAGRPLEKYFGAPRKSVGDAFGAPRLATRIRNINFANNIMV